MLIGSTEKTRGIGVQKERRDYRNERIEIAKERQLVNEVGVGGVDISVGMV